MELKQYAPLPLDRDWLSSFDTYLIGEGTDERAYEKLGAHLVHMPDQDGVAFAVWAPNARQVSVIGDFNRWNQQSHAMQPSDSGIWTLFIPGLVCGTLISGVSFAPLFPFDRDRKSVV